MKIKIAGIGIQKRIILFFPILIVLMGLTGCISTVGKKYYQLYLDEDPDSAAQVNGIQTGNGILLVESIEVEDIYDDYRVVYRTSPYQLNYYSYHFWIKKPRTLMRRCIIDYFSKSKLFKEVVTGFSRGEPDFVLKAVVYNLEEYDQPGVWFAHLKMDIEVREYKSGQRVLLHSFDRHRRLAAKKVERVPVSISKILKEELDKAAKKMVQVLK